MQAGWWCLPGLCVITLFLGAEDRASSSSCLPGALMSRDRCLVYSLDSSWGVVSYIQESIWAHWVLYWQEAMFLSTGKAWADSVKWSLEEWGHSAWPGWKRNAIQRAPGDSQKSGWSKGNLLPLLQKTAIAQYGSASLKTGHQNYCFHLS